MKFLTFASILAVAVAVRGSSFHYESLNKSDAVLVFVDPEVGLYQYAYNKNRQFEQSFRAQAEIAPLFDLPVVLAGSEKNGVNNDLAPIIESLFPSALHVKRKEVNPWDNALFRRSLEITSRKQVILTGVLTEACTTFLALSLRANGYEVFFNTDASNSVAANSDSNSIRRMERAGVNMMDTYSITMDLMGNWESEPDYMNVMSFMKNNLPEYWRVEKLRSDYLNTRDSDDEADDADETDSEFENPDNEKQRKKTEKTTRRVKEILEHTTDV